MRLPGKFIGGDAFEDAIDEAKRETRFYADQSEALATFINYLGTTISVIFSIGAIIGAMITMYASVASRTAEIGTLRALGFSRGSILTAFLGESLLLGLLGGVIGLTGAGVGRILHLLVDHVKRLPRAALSFEVRDLCQDPTRPQIGAE